MTKRGDDERRGSPSTDRPDAGPMTPLGELAGELRQRIESLRADIARLQHAMETLNDASRASSGRLDRLRLQAELLRTVLDGMGTSAVDRRSHGERRVACDRRSRQRDGRSVRAAVETPAPPERRNAGDRRNGRDRRAAAGRSASSTACPRRSPNVVSLAAVRAARAAGQGRDPT